MKIIIAIIASHGQEKEFKDIWIKNIKFVHKMHPGIFEFYFLYSRSCCNCENDAPEIREIMYNTISNYYDFYYYKKKDWTRQNSILMKTLDFYKYIHNKTTGTMYCVRTNLSTLFDFTTFLQWISDKPKENLYAGHVIDFYTGTCTAMSGTCIILSHDIVSIFAKMIFNKQFLYDFPDEEDDSCISFLILQLLRLDPFMINIPRVDFIKINKQLDPLERNGICFSKFDPNNYKKNNIFLYRFKTNDRKYDASLMNSILCTQGCKKLNEIDLYSYNLPFYIQTNSNIEYISNNILKKNDKIE